MVLLEQMLRARRGLVGLTVAVSVLSIAISLLWNDHLSKLINAVNGKTPVPIQFVFIAAALILLSAAVAYGLGWLSGWTCETLAHDLRMGFAHHFTTLPYAQIEELAVGEQLSKLQNEMADVSNFFRNNLFSIINDAIRFVVTFGWLLWLNPTLTLLVNLPVALLLWYTAWSSRVIGGLAQQSQQANADMGGYAELLVSLFPVIRLFDAAPLLVRKYAEALTRWEVSGIREERTKALLMSLSALMSCLPLLLLFLLGGWQVIHGSMSIGTLYIFINLSGNVSGVLMNMPGRIAAFRRFQANMERLAPTILLRTGRDHGHHRSRS